MKKMLLVSFLGLCAISFTGCATTGETTVEPANRLPPPKCAPSKTYVAKNDYESFSTGQKVLLEIVKSGIAVGVGAAVGGATHTAVGPLVASTLAPLPTTTCCQVNQEYRPIKSVEPISKK